MMIKLLYTLMAIGLATTLSGCGVGISHLDEVTVNLRDGSQVRCVKYKAGYAGGISCDWAHLNKTVTK